MLYSTIVDKNEEGLQMVIDAAEKFEQGRYLNAILDCHLKKNEILMMTEFVREYKAKLSREHLALAKFALTFNSEYATKNNLCFNTAERLFNRIRSTIKCTKKIYKNLCRTTRRRLPATAPQRPSVFKRSRLVSDYRSGLLFGIETYEDCVQKLYDQLEAFFFELVKCLALCRMIITDEKNTRNNPELCAKIYKECYEKMLSDTRTIIRTLKKNRMVITSEMEERKKNAGSLQDFICSNYHKFDPEQFKLHVIASELNKGDDMTALEKILFGANNKELVEKARIVITHFDELELNAHKGKHKDKHSAYCVASFMLWCGIGTTNDNKVSLFVDDYFNLTYKGEYPPVKTNAVNSAKNILLYDKKKSSLDNAEFHARIDALVEKYYVKNDSYTDMKISV